MRLICDYCVHKKERNPLDRENLYRPNCIDAQKFECSDNELYKENFRMLNQWGDHICVMHEWEKDILGVAMDAYFADARMCGSCLYLETPIESVPCLGCYNKSEWEPTMALAWKTTNNLDSDKRYIYVGKGLKREKK